MDNHLCNSPKIHMLKIDLNGGYLYAAYNMLFVCTNLTWAIISFRFEVINAIGLTRCIIVTVINTACWTLTIHVQAIIPIFVLSNVLKRIVEYYLYHINIIQIILTEHWQIGLSQSWHPRSHSSPQGHSKYTGYFLSPQFACERDFQFFFRHTF